MYARRSDFKGQRDEDRRHECPVIQTCNPDRHANTTNTIINVNYNAATTTTTNDNTDDDNDNKQYTNNKQSNNT